jgi:hypothetical protein
VECTPSEFAHESQGLWAIRDWLPDRDPFYAFSNFTFLDTQHRPNEVDLLVIAPSGVHLIELKGWSGRLTGGQGEWTIRDRPGGGRDLDVPSPFILADKKAKRLRSVPRKRQPSSQAPAPGAVHRRGGIPACARRAQRAGRVVSGACLRS